jgi:hypothetical protein
MKIARRVMQIFGVAIEVKPLCPKVAERLKAHKAEMAECGKCHKLYVGRYPLALISHLTEDHGVDSFVAIEIIEDLGRKTLAKHAEHRARVAVVSAS